MYISRFYSFVTFRPWLLLVVQNEMLDIFIILTMFILLQNLRGRSIVNHPIQISFYKMYGWKWRLTQRWCPSYMHQSYRYIIDKQTLLFQQPLFFRQFFGFVQHIWYFILWISFEMANFTPTTIKLIYHAMRCRI